MAESSSPMLCLSLLGVTHIEHDGSEVRLARRQSKLLLAFLALYPQLHSRDELAKQISDSARARDASNSLRIVLTDLRRGLGPGAIITSRETIQLNPDFPIWVDAREFTKRERLIRAWDEQHATEPSGVATLESTIALYRGDLLLDFYDDWVIRERERYRALYLQALLHLVTALQMANAYERAIETARLILSTDPGNEGAYQHLMRCHLARGNRQAALETYQECARALSEELGAEPSSEITALYHRIKQASGAPSLAARLTNLPIPSTSFVGRSRELSEVKHALLDRGKCEDERPFRLVTLTGPGGSGKTRLAIRAATDLIDAFQDGAWWVELGPLSDSALVPIAVARALGINENPEQPLDETLVDALHTKQLLLVLDNCEHLIDTVARLVTQLLTRCQRITILATSREPLCIPGECTWSVPSLSFPTVEATSLAMLLGEYESVRLFTERARSTQPNFVLTDENAPAVAQICRRLDGLPLAIELAAVRARELTPAQIAARLDHRFILLTDNNRKVLPRQQTLRALINWSYDLLSEEERILFGRLSLFEGGWTLNAAERICGQCGIDPKAVLDILGRLVDKSLVIAECLNGDSRYRMLETIQEYARERLEQAGETAELMSEYYSYFTELAEEGANKLLSAESQSWQERLDAEHNNLRAALRWAFTQPDAHLGLRLAGAMWRFWQLRGHIQEGAQWLSRALERAPEESDETPGSSQHRGHALSGLGTLALVRGDYKHAEEFHRRALEQYQKTGNEHDIAFALDNIAAQLLYQGAYETAIQYALDSIVLSKRNGDEMMEAWSRTTLGISRMRLGEMEQAERDFRSHLEWARRNNLQINLAYVLHNLGELSIMNGELEPAHAYLDESLRLFEHLGTQINAAIDLVYLGLVDYLAGDNGSSFKCIYQALEIFREHKIQSDVAEALDVLGMLAYRQGTLAQSATLLGAADAVRAVLCSPIPRAFENHIRSTYSALASVPEHVLLQAAMERGRALTPDQAMDLAMQNKKLQPPRLLSSL